jgi:hypothetical protein
MGRKEEWEKQEQKGINNAPEKIEHLWGRQEVIQKKGWARDQPPCFWYSPVWYPSKEGEERCVHHSCVCVCVCVCVCERKIRLYPLFTEAPRLFGFPIPQVCQLLLLGTAGESKEPWMWSSLIYWYTTKMSGLFLVNINLFCFVLCFSCLWSHRT